MNTGASLLAAVFAAVLCAAGPAAGDETGDRLKELSLRYGVESGRLLEPVKFEQTGLPSEIIATVSDRRAKRVRRFYRKGQVFAASRKPVTQFKVTLVKELQESLNGLRVPLDSGFLRDPAYLRLSVAFVYPGGRTLTLTRFQLNTLDRYRWYVSTNDTTYAYFPDRKAQYRFHAFVKELGRRYYPITEDLELSSPPAPGASSANPSSAYCGSWISWQEEPRSAALWKAACGEALLRTEEISRFAAAGYSPGSVDSLELLLGCECGRHLARGNVTLRLSHPGRGQDEVTMPFTVFVDGSCVPGATFEEAGRYLAGARGHPFVQRLFATVRDHTVSCRFPDEWDAERLAEVSAAFSQRAGDPGRYVIVGIGMAARTDPDYYEKLGDNSFVLGQYFPASGIMALPYLRIERSVNPGIVEDLVTACIGDEALRSDIQRRASAVETDGTGGTLCRAPGGGRGKEAWLSAVAADDTLEMTEEGGILSHALPFAERDGSLRAVAVRSRWWSRYVY